NVWPFSARHRPAPRRASFRPRLEELEGRIEFAAGVGPAAALTPAATQPGVFSTATPAQGAALATPGATGGAGAVTSGSAAPGASGTASAGTSVTGVFPTAGASTAGVSGVSNFNLTGSGAAGLNAATFNGAFFNAVAGAGPTAQAGLAGRGRPGR